MSDREQRVLLASVYKFMMWVEAELDAGRNPWRILDATREMLGQEPYQMDGVSYYDMRRFIEEFPEAHALRSVDYP